MSQNLQVCSCELCPNIVLNGRNGYRDSCIAKTKTLPTKRQRDSETKISICLPRVSKFLTNKSLKVVKKIFLKNHLASLCIRINAHKFSFVNSEFHYFIHCASHCILFRQSVKCGSLFITS